MENVFQKILDYLPDIGVAVLILVLGVILTLIIAKIAKKAMGRSKLDPSLTAFFVRLIHIFCYVMIAIAVLSKLGVSPTGLIAFFSASMAAVALALKDNIADIASGIVLLFTRPFVTGDFIEFGAHKGFVTKIDLIHTRIRTYDDTEVIVPNSKITTTEVNNYSSSPEIRVVINVPISYKADLDKTKEVLFNTAVRCWCYFEDYWTVYFKLTESIKKALDENDIAIPFNQLDVHIIDQPKS